MVITELNRRDVLVVRFNPAGIGEDLAVSARFVSAPARSLGRLRFQHGGLCLAQLWRQG
ncbi:hypothetical protein ACFVWX_29600 [Streptomyces sp. NPDC058220]|uniref:hypothetical protein n=1 Tax=unclassified Streptomyces TaxID=2593676 RepID=UPI0036464BD3